MIDMTTFKQAYENEIRLIQVNGGDKSAVQFRYDQLKDTRRKLLNDIVSRSIEITAREKALSEYVKKLQEEAP